MTIKHQPLAILPIKKLTTTAIDDTTQVSTNKLPDQVSSIQRMSVEQLAQCQQGADAIEQHAEKAASSAQYLNAAKTLMHCLVGLTPDNDSPKSPISFEGNEQQAVMKIMASATLNFIKAGDVVSANEMVETFKIQHPKHDLYFSDYTSFLDTATALLTTDNLSAGQLSSLNISRALRYEIERKHYWLSH
jgi:hypothetical protein